MPRHVIVNADDLGASTGINRGILEAHLDGVVTSASLMVTGAAVEEAAELARRHDSLAVGLHFDVDGEGASSPFSGDEAAVREELERQLDAFQRLLGRPPTHLDSHHHYHRSEPAWEVFVEYADRLDLPLRERGPVRYVGGFYAQWEYLVTDLSKVSIEAFEGMLEHDVVSDWTEIGCHPGYVSDDFESVYLHEREAELATLTDPRVRAAIDRAGLRLVSFSDAPAR